MRYEYTCRQCKGKPIKIKHDMNEEVSVYCINCKELLRKVIGFGGFVLKGGGYHSTDYKS